MIDHELYDELLKANFPGACIIHKSESAPKEVAEGKITEINNSNVVLINAEGKYGGSLRQSYAGIEILIWLRVKHEISCPVILYGFSSAHQILSKHPEYIIIHGPCNSYLQLPFAIEELRRFQNISFADEISNNSYKPFIKPLINLEKIRHNAANWIGMSKMYEVINSYSNGVIQENQIINSSDEDTFFKYRKSLDYNLLSTYFGLEKCKVDIPNADQIKRIKTEFKSNSPRILYIDDMANKGWGKLFSHSIYDEFKNKNFRISLAIAESDYGKMIQRVLEEIKEQKSDIVLLDLRLKNEEGRQDIKNLGGYKILIAIKEKFPGLPVIITSATNNGNTIKILLNSGAESVWTKPGIDEQNSANQTIERYIDFLHQVQNAFFKFTDLNVDDRTKALQKLQFTKYRLGLYDYDFKSFNLQPISGFTDIIIDTNFLLQTNVHDENNNPIKINIVDSISNLYKLAYITTNHTTVNQDERCKVMLMNVIIDEIIKCSKTKKGDESKAAQFAYSVIMDMFTDNIVHTEYTGKENPGRDLKAPKENIYADGFILDEIGAYLVTQKIRKKYVKNKSLLLVTNDRPLTKKALAIGHGKKLTVWNITKLNTIMHEIKI